VSPSGPERPRVPDPALAYRNEEFLASEEGRPVRILSEYLQPLHAFRRQRVSDTIVFFGSARLEENGPLARYYAAARELARRVTLWSAELDPSAAHFLVCTGGGGGIMEAANRGASDAGGRSIGLNIGLPHEQRPNAWISKDLSFQFHYFFMRKLWFAYLARAIVAFPGGFGTLDELFEILTLAQTRKLERPIAIVLYGSEYWNEVLNLPALVRHGMIREEDLELIHFVDDPVEALAVLRVELAPEPEPRTPSIAKSVTPADTGPAGGVAP